MDDRRALAIAAAWLLAAGLFTQLGGVRAFPPPVPLGGCVLLLLAGYAFRKGFRDWVDAQSAGRILALHLSRFVGFYFLVLYGRGELPYEFAVIGGWGDVFVATAASALLAAHRGSPPARSSWLQLWNLLGLVDILYVVVTAARFALDEPETIVPLTRLPLGLLPTFLVPLIIASHVVLLLRGMQQLRGTA